MAVDHHAPPESDRPSPYSPIENEIPTYRAISPMALVSFLLGLLAVVSFASLAFIAFGVAAIVTGALAQRSISRSPDALTGRVFAKLGIALGIIFSLSAMTFVTVRDINVRRSAAVFATNYAETLKAGNVADAFWFRMPPTMRTGRTPARALSEMESNSAANDPTMRENQVGPIERIVNAVNLPGGSVRFVEIERAGFDRVTPYALAIFEIQEGMVPHDHDDHEGHDHDHESTPGPVKYAIVEMRSQPESPTFDWYIENMTYPYERGSYTIAPAPIDDGHGHAH